MYLSIPKNFCPSPAGRYPGDGPFNGQRFRNDFLVPALEEALRTNSTVIVDFDDADSYSSSFLEEAFGGLVRLKKFTKQDIAKRLVLKSDDPVYAAYVADAKDYISSELKKIR